ncbi:MAG TPA: hypothetical protein VLJ37_01500 [bacterium]|nr:hypothetical protein [bacterium]
MTALLFEGLATDSTSIAGSSVIGPSPWFTANERHRPFLMGARQGLAASLLSEDLRKTVGGALDAARLGAIPAGRAADFLWQTLALDFFTAVPGSSVGYDAQDGILEFRCRATFLKSPTIFFSDRLQAIGRFLNLPYALYEEARDEATVRIPTLGFLEGEANRLGRMASFGAGGSAEWSYALGEMPRDDFNREHLEGRQAIALPTDLIYLSHAGCLVHPFIFAKHDVYHAVLVATLPVPLRTMAAGLYEAVRGLPPELRGLPFVDPMMDFLSDKELPRGATDDLVTGAFFYVRDDIRQNQASDLHRRFLAEVHAAWEPFVHESRRAYVAAYLKNLLS